MISPVKPPENVFLLNFAGKGNVIVAVDPYENKETIKGQLIDNKYGGLTT